MRGLRRTALTAATAVAIAVVLAGCTATSPAASPRPSVSPGFSCPTADEVAGLTAVPFTGGMRKAPAGGTCSYSATSDDGTVRIAVGRRTGSSTTLSGYRYGAIAAGRATQDAEDLSFDAFTEPASSGCTAWLYAGDAVVTTVTATRPGSGAAGACALARSVGVLLQDDGQQPATTAPPVVGLIAPARLLGPRARTERLGARLGLSADARIDLRTTKGAGFTVSDGARAAASTVRPDTDAVVFLAGDGDVGRSALSVLKASTAAFADAARAAPRARIVVVGPLLGSDESPAEVGALSGALRSAARIAGAAYIDPVAGGWGTTTGQPISAGESGRVADALTKRVAAVLRRR